MLEHIDEVIIRYCCKMDFNLEKTSYCFSPGRAVTFYQKNVIYFDCSCLDELVEANNGNPSRERP